MCFQAYLSQAPRWAKALFDEIKKSKAETEKQIAELASKLSSRDQQSTDSRNTVPRSLKTRISVSMHDLKVKINV